MQPQYSHLLPWATPASQRVAAHIALLLPRAASWAKVQQTVSEKGQKISGFVGSNCTLKRTNYPIVSCSVNSTKTWELLHCWHVGRSWMTANDPLIHINESGSKVACENWAVMLLIYCKWATANELKAFEGLSYPFFIVLQNLLFFDVSTSPTLCLMRASAPVHSVPGPWWRLGTKILVHMVFQTLSIKYHILIETIDSKTLTIVAQESWNFEKWNSYSLPKSGDSNSTVKLSSEACDPCQGQVPMGIFSSTQPSIPSVFTPLFGYCKYL